MVSHLVIQDVLLSWAPYLHLPAAAGPAQLVSGGTLGTMAVCASSWVTWQQHASHPHELLVGNVPQSL
jgi:hypothetical protein